MLLALSVPGHVRISFSLSSLFLFHCQTIHMLFLGMTDAIFLGSCSSAPVYSTSRVSRELTVSSRHISFIVTAGTIKSVLPACVSARCPPSMWWLHLAGGWYILYHVSLSHQSFSQFFLTSLSHKPTSLSHRSFFCNILSHYPHVSTTVSAVSVHPCTLQHY